jgi:hypothetical protein
MPGQRRLAAGFSWCGWRLEVEVNQCPVKPPRKFLRPWSAVRSSSRGMSLDWRPQGAEIFSLEGPRAPLVASAVAVVSRMTTGVNQYRTDFDIYIYRGQ